MGNCFFQRFVLFFASVVIVALMSCAVAADSLPEDRPIILRTMGSMFFGGIVTRSDNGVTFHGDHGYAQYYIPQAARQYPLVMWHGIGQSGKTYESTPDGREGFQAILTRRDWPVYIIDQPRRGRAGRTQAGQAAFVPPVLASEDGAWNAFRVGTWAPPNAPAFYPDIQFPKDAYSIDQFMRQQTPDTGEEPWSAEYRAYLAETMADLFKATGPGVLITHSKSGIYGWDAAIAAPGLIKAVVAYEPGHVVFPENEIPADIPANHPGITAAATPITISMEDFRELTQIPILIVYGDYIPSEPFDVLDADFWRVASLRAKQFAEAINRHGGDAQVVMLPEIGIKGNSHFPFADLNNIEIAEQLESWLHAKKLDGRTKHHKGPAKRELSMSIPVR